MTNINDLKRNNINTTRLQQQKFASVDDLSNDIVIDNTTPQNLASSIDRNNQIYNNTPKGKTIILQKTSNTNDRVDFDITKMPSEPAPEDIHSSITDDILSGKNPILYDYIKEKTEEAEKWDEERTDKAKLAETEMDKDDDISIDITSSNNKEKEEDSLSLEKYEVDSSNKDESYQMLDDITIDDDTEIEIEEDEDDIVVIDNDIEEEDMAEKDITTEELDTDPVDELNNEDNKDIDFNTDNTVDSNKDEEKVEDTFISSEGIEFQDTEGIKQDAIKIEEEVTYNDNEIDPKATELDPGAKHIIELASKVLKPAAKKLDLTSFTVVKKPGAVTKFIEQKPIKVAKWVLRTKKVCVHMKAAQGSELEELRTLITDADTSSDYIRIYRIIYDHIVSPKPTSFEAWCKSTYIDDIDDYFFCFYIANYMNSNYIPYDCTNENCKPGTFLSDNIPIMNMVKFASEKDKAEFNEIYKSEIFDNNPAGLYATERIPFSNNIAIGFKMSTLYSYIESISIKDNEKFVTTYAAAITFAPYIDDIYAIDIEDKNLIPIQYKVYPNSNVNTYKSKIQKYDSILKCLDPDEFATLTTYISTFSSDNKNSIKLKYIRPAAVCPDCGAKIDEVETTAQSLVFFRYQLGQMVNISIK